MWHRGPSLGRSLMQARRLAGADDRFCAGIGLRLQRAPADSRHQQAGALVIGVGHRLDQPRRNEPVGGALDHLARMAERAADLRHGGRMRSLNHGGEHGCFHVGEIAPFACGGEGAAQPAVDTGDRVNEQDQIGVCFHDGTGIP
jgi:hypothetical protein